MSKEKDEIDPDEYIESLPHGGKRPPEWIEERWMK